MEEYRQLYLAIVLLGRGSGGGDVTRVERVDRVKQGEHAPHPPLSACWAENTIIT